MSAKLPPEVKQKWVAALRSGDYLQGTQYLRTEHKGPPRYCCLGVLCDLLGAKWIQQIGTPVYATEHKSTNVPQHTEYTPEIWRALDADCLPGRSYLARLMAMNDGGCSFAKIAQYIEKEL